MTAVEVYPVIPTPALLLLLYCYCFVLLCRTSSCPQSTALTPAMPCSSCTTRPSTSHRHLSRTSKLTVTSKFNELVYQYPIRIPERYSLVIRSLLTQEGICMTLKPEFHFLEVAYPYVARWVVCTTLSCLTVTLTVLSMVVACVSCCMTWCDQVCQLSAGRTMPRLRDVVLL